MILAWLVSMTSIMTVDGVNGAVAVLPATVAIVVHDEGSSGAGTLVESLRTPKSTESGHSGPGAASSPISTGALESRQASQSYRGEQKANMVHCCRGEATGLLQGRADQGRSGSLTAAPVSDEYHGGSGFLSCRIRRL
jgi:hypothetical protein